MAIEIEEPTLFENILQYGLFAAAIFQIICIMAAIFIPKSESEQVMWHRTFEFRLAHTEYWQSTVPDPAGFMVDMAK